MSDLLLYEINVPNIYRIHGSGTGSSHRLHAADPVEAARLAVKDVVGYHWDEAATATIDSAEAQYKRGRVHPKPQDEVVISWTDPAGQRALLTVVVPMPHQISS